MGSCPYCYTIIPPHQFTPIPRNSHFTVYNSSAHHKPNKTPFHFHSHTNKQNLHHSVSINQTYLDLLFRVSCHEPLRDELDDLLGELAVVAETLDALEELRDGPVDLPYSPRRDVEGRPPPALIALCVLLYHAELEEEDI